MLQVMEAWSALYVCLICLSYMSALYVCLICRALTLDAVLPRLVAGGCAPPLFGWSALYVCLIRLPDLSGWLQADVLRRSFSTGNCPPTPPRPSSSRYCLIGLCLICLPNVSALYSSPRIGGCMFACVYVCVCACVRVCMYTCISIYCVYIYAYLCKDTNMYSSLYLCIMCVCMCICVCT